MDDDDDAAWVPEKALRWNYVRLWWRLGVRVLVGLALCATPAVLVRFGVLDSVLLAPTVVAGVLVLVVTAFRMPQAFVWMRACRSILRAHPLEPRSRAVLKNRTSGRRGTIDLRAAGFPTPSRGGRVG